MLPLFIIAIVSLVIYIIFLYILIKHKKSDDFDTPFFTITIFLGIQDMVFLISSWFFLKFPIFGWFGVDKLVRRFHDLFAFLFPLFTFQTSIGQQIGMATLALNRYTAICRHTQHELIWTKGLVLASIVAQFVGPLPGTIAVALTVQLAYPIDNVTGQIGGPPYNINPTVQFYLFMFKCALFFANNLLMLILYTLIVRKIRQHLSQVSASGQGSQLNNTDKKLAFFGLSVFIINFIYDVFFFAMAFVSPDRDLTAYVIIVAIYSIISDLLAYCNPYFMLMFSRSVRKHFWDIIRCKHSEQ